MIVVSALTQGNAVCMLYEYNLGLSLASLAESWRRLLPVERWPIKTRFGTINYRPKVVTRDKIYCNRSLQDFVSPYGEVAVFSSI